MQSPIGKTRGTWSVLRLDDASREALSINSEFDETWGDISPDGGWLAYTTDRSSRTEVWIARFPNGEDSRQISVNGGTNPRWSRDGEDLFFVSADNQMMASSVDPDTSPLDPGIPTALFELSNNVGLFDRSMSPYSVSPDGELFLVLVLADVPQPPIHIIVNWQVLLEN